MNCKPVYLKQQEHALENILILMLGKVCIQNSSNGNIKLAPRAKIVNHRLNFSLKLRCSPTAGRKEHTFSPLSTLPQPSQRWFPEGSFRGCSTLCQPFFQFTAPVPKESQTNCCSITLQASNPLLWLYVSPGQSSSQKSQTIWLAQPSTCLIQQSGSKKQENKNYGNASWNFACIEADTDPNLVNVNPEGLCWGQGCRSGNLILLLCLILSTAVF